MKLKRIVLLIQNPKDEDLKEFIRYVGEYGVEVTFLTSDDKDNELVITDSREDYLSLKKAGLEALIEVEAPEGTDRFPEGRYFNINLWDTDFEYLDKVYRRIHDLPWDICETERLKIRETTEADVDAFYEIYKDPDMYRYAEKLYDDPEEERKYAREYRDKVYACQEYGIWTLIEKASNRVIGRAGIITRAGYDHVEVGFAIDKRLWGQHYGTEAVKACLKYARDHELGPVQALVMEGNTRSISLLKGLGFEYKETVVENRQEYLRYETLNSID